MAHFSKIVDGIVVNCVCVANSDCAGGDFPDSEPSGQVFLASCGFDGEWRQTSYNKNFRKYFGGIGMAYNSDLDMFINPSPYPSWVLDDQGDWQAPEPKPEGDYTWNELTLSWDEIK